MKHYTEEHEWIELQGDLAIIGITQHAAEELGDITFVELPEVGAEFGKGDVLLVIESVKAAADVYCPAAGCVVEVNQALEDRPELINESPEAKAWLCKLSGVAAGDLDGMMTAEQYQAFLSA